MKGTLTINYFQKIIDEARKSEVIYITLYQLSSRRTLHILEVGKELGLLEFKVISPSNGGRFAEVRLADKYKKLANSV